MGTPRLSFILLASVLLAKAQTPQTVSSLLQRVESTYRSIGNYEIEVTSKTDPPYGDADLLVPPGVGPHASFLNPELRQPPTKKVLLARSGNASHFEEESRDEEGKVKRSAWISNGQTAWFYNGKTNRYFEEPSSRLNNDTGRRPGLLGAEWLYLAKFRVLATAAQANILSDDVPADANCAGLSTIVRLSLADGRYRATEELRILKDSRLVCQSIVRNRLPYTSPIAQPEVVTTTWNYIQINGQLARRELFDFVPPPGAKYASSRP
jgi:hypothetical protein